MSGGNMTEEARVRMLTEICYCPSWRESGEHGKHPKCRECRYREVAK